MGMNRYTRGLRPKGAQRLVLAASAGVLSVGSLSSSADWLIKSYAKAAGFLPPELKETS